MILKRIASISFALAFLSAILLFTNLGTDIVPRSVARILFISFGAIGLFLNLLSYRTGKHNPIFSFFYWMGSVVVFMGLIFMLMHWPFSLLLILGGMFLLGLSFFIPASRNDDKVKDEELLDDF